MWSNEEIAISNNICGIVTTKMSYAVSGIIQPTSRIDPGFGWSKISTETKVGRSLQIPLYNTGTETITIPKDRTFSNLLFINLQTKTEQYNPPSNSPFERSSLYSEVEGKKLSEKLKILIEKDERFNIIWETMQELYTHQEKK